MATRHKVDRPDDWLNGTFQSPIEDGAVSSPKKRLPVRGCPMPKSMPSLSRSPGNSTTRDDDEDDLVEEVYEEIIEVDDATSDGEEPYDEDYEEVIEEFVEVSSDGEDDDESSSDFDPLPEPVEIPDYLKPKDIRGGGNSNISNNADDEDDTVEEEFVEEVEEEEVVEEEEDIKMAKKAFVSPMRPGHLRGHSCDSTDSELREAAGAVRRARKKKTTASADSDDDVEEEEEAAAASSEEEEGAPKEGTVNPLRPSVVRGTSCDKTVQEIAAAAGTAKRGGKKPTKDDDVEEPEIPKVKPYVVSSPTPSTGSAAVAAAPSSPTAANLRSPPLAAAATSPRSPVAAPRSPVAATRSPTPRSPVNRSPRRPPADDDDDYKDLSWKKPGTCANACHYFLSRA